MGHDDKRQRILAAATAVFEKRDFHQVLVSEVASRAGVGKGTVYLYFPTKDELHRGALEASLERVALEVEAAAAVGVREVAAAASEGHSSMSLCIKCASCLCFLLHILD